MSVMDYVARIGIIGLGMIYPGYQSFKSVKRNDVASQQSWLKYWLVLSVLAALMLVVEPLLYHRVPMYNFIKVGIVAYLVLPMTKGFLAVYDAVLLPQLDRHERAIDDAAANFMKASEQHARNLRPLVNKYANQARSLASRPGQSNHQGPPKKAM